MIWNAATLAFILRGSRFLKYEGFIFLAFLSIYAVGRLVLSFVRLENTFFGGLQQAQIVAIFVFVFSVIAMVYLRRKSRLTGDLAIAKQLYQGIRK